MKDKKLRDQQRASKSTRRGRRGRSSNRLSARFLIVGELQPADPFKEKKVYTCWSGGKIEDGETKLTLIGKAALEALVNLPGQQ